MSIAAEQNLPHLNQLSLADIWLSCGRKYSRQQYNHVIRCIEAELDDVTRAMLNSNDHGFGFLKLAIHPGSTPSSMAIIYEKIINQTTWKYKPTALRFVGAVDTLFKFVTKDASALEKLPMDTTIFSSKEEYLETLSELTIYYIVRLLEKDDKALAS